MGSGGAGDSSPAASAGGGAAGPPGRADASRAEPDEQRAVDPPAGGDTAGELEREALLPAQHDAAAPRAEAAASPPGDTRLPAYVPPGLAEAHAPALPQKSSRSAGMAGRASQGHASKGTGGEMSAAVDVLTEVASHLTDGGNATQSLDKAVEQLEHKEYRCRILAMTVITAVKLIIENALGAVFLTLSITSCNQMADAIEGCVGSFDQCVAPLLTPDEVAQCELRSDLNAEYVQWSSACTPRAGSLMMPVVAPSALSLAMTLMFVIVGVIRSVRRIRQRKAPKMDWSKLTEVHAPFNHTVSPSSTTCPFP
jgi:hypothetical protein